MNMLQSMLFLTLLLAFTSHVASFSTCSSDLDCSLNGLCVSGACSCDAPWSGPSCALLTFSSTQDARGKDLYPITDTEHNTWNGPIVGPVDGMFYMYLPLYPKQDLYHPTEILLGQAPTMYGPWSFTNLTGVTVAINPGAMAYNDTKTGKPVYTLWLKKKNSTLYVSDSPAGPFKATAAYPSGCGINASPLYLNGTFYCTGSKGTAIYTTTDLIKGEWTLHSNVTKVTGGEDPFLWVDARQNWHMLYHTSGGSITHCSNSSVAQHYFSQDNGISWNSLAIQPYKPVVNWPDGEQVYATMERPHAYFDSAGRMTYLSVAADIETGDEGCGQKPSPCFPSGKIVDVCTCAACKYIDHGGTLLIAVGN